VQEKEWGMEMAACSGLLVRLIHSQQTDVRAISEAEASKLWQEQTWQSTLTWQRSEQHNRSLAPMRHGNC